MHLIIATALLLGTGTFQTLGQKRTFVYDDDGAARALAGPPGLVGRPIHFASGATVDKYSAGGAFLLQFGAPGSGPNRFVYPSRVAVAADRTVYVADARDNTVSAHSPTGTELFSVSSSQTPNPRGIGVEHCISFP